MLLILVFPVVNAADFRPISCLNAMYKVVAKLLAIRLQSLLALMIFGNQTPFVSGRLIVENVLLASEMVQGYNNSNISRRGMLKIDLKRLLTQLSGVLSSISSRQQFSTNLYQMDSAMHLYN